MPTVTAKGQVTLPKAIRDELGLFPGSQVEFVIEEGRVVLRKRVSPAAFERWEGALHGKLPAGAVDEMLERLRGERLRDDEARR